MITTVLLIAFLAAVGKMVLLWRFGLLKRLSRLHGLLDLLVGLLFAWMFFGTMTGMVIGLMAGLFFSGLIEIYRRTSRALYGSDKLVRQGWRVRFVHVPGALG